MATHEGDQIRVETFPNGIVAGLTTDHLLDPVEVEAVGRQLREALRAADPANIVVSLEGVTVLSSLMLGVLAVLRSEAQARGGTVVLASVPDRIRHLLEVTNMSRAFPSFATTDEARASFA